MARNGKDNIYNIPIDLRQRIAARGSSAFSNAVEIPNPIEFHDIIECEFVLNGNAITIQLKTDQNKKDENGQPDTDANYELLNYIYDNFEEHTNFFKRVKLRFLI